MEDKLILKVTAIGISRDITSDRTWQLPTYCLAEYRYPYSISGIDRRNVQLYRHSRRSIMFLVLYTMARLFSGQIYMVRAHSRQPFIIVQSMQTNAAVAFQA